MIQTVTGAIDPGDLGLVLAHEHVILRSPGVAEEYPETYPREAVADVCVNALATVRNACGVNTIIDHTTLELGRDVRLLADVSRRSGVRIIAATGLWHQPPMYFQRRTAAQAAAMFVRDIEHGFAETGIRAGVIKCGIDQSGMTPSIETCVRAAAKAHRATGIPLTSHTSVANGSGEMLARVLLDEGVDMRRVVIGHSGDSEDRAYLKRLLATGAFLGMDRFGSDEVLPDDTRVEVVAELCRAGHSRQLLLSHDATAWNQWRSSEVRELQKPRWHFQHLFSAILPRLRDAGVTDTQIHEMLVENPRRLFSTQEPY